MISKAFQLKKVSLAVASVIFSGQALAAGFALNDHSATASGMALAGAAASKSDISFSFWNPALFTNAKGVELYGSLAVIDPDMDVTVNSASSPAAFGGLPLSGAKPTDIVDTTLVPSMYFAFPLSEKTILGASLNVPFGLSGEYGDEWAGRFHSAKTAVEDISLSATLAHRVNEKLSLGFSAQAHRGKVTLESAIPDSPLLPTDQEGYGSLKADDISYGFALGAAFEPTEDTRIGVGYRSEIDFEFEGDATYSNISPALGAAGANLGIDNAAISDNLTFPSVLTLSAEHDYSDKLSLGVTVMRTGWKSLDEMRIKFEEGSDGKAQNDSVLTFDFENQWFYSLGGTYAASENLVLRAGIAYDQSPSKDAYRSARTPDGDRKWLSTGMTYSFANGTEITAAYTHVSIDDVSVVRTGTLPEDGARGALDADYESSANVFSLAVNTKF